MSLLDIFSKKSGAASLKKKPSLRQVMPYGDLLNDGAMQLSFTFPVPSGDQAREAAKKYVEKLGFKNVLVAHTESMGENLCYFVVYAQATQTIDYTKVKVPRAHFEKMDYDQIQAYAQKHFKKRLVVVGATTGTDAHTLGLDAIMNMKGYLGDFGLERYDCFHAYNLRSQVSHEELIKKAVQLHADVLLVSKVVTQRDRHLDELKELAKEIKAESRLSKKLITIAGGPRLDHAQAAKLGYDAGFGQGTLPSEVASFIVQEYARRHEP